MQEEVEHRILGCARLQVGVLELLDTRARHLLRERLELLELASAGVLRLPCVLATAVEEHGVAGDAFLPTQRTVCLAVYFDDVQFVAHEAGELRPVRRKLLAMSAPAV